MIIRPIRTRIFQEGDDLFAFITDYIKKLPEKSVVVVTSKIVALSEKRTAIAEHIGDKEKLIRAESDLAMPTKYVWLTVKDGIVIASPPNFCRRNLELSAKKARRLLLFLKTAKAFFFWPKVQVF